MERRFSPVLITALCFGIAVLYIPMLVLIAYSFNASPLVSVWGGFSTQWYVALMHNRQMLQAALLSLEVAVRRLHRRGRAGHAWPRLRWCVSRASAAGCC